MSEVSTDPQVTVAPQALPPVVKHRSASAHSGGMSWLQSFATTIVIAVFVITFIVQAFQIPSESMEKTLLVGDYLLVDKVHYGQSLMWRWLLPYHPIQRKTSSSFAIPSIRNSTS